MIGAVLISSRKSAEKISVEDAVVDLTLALQLDPEQVDHPAREIDRRKQEIVEVVMALRRKPGLLQQRKQRPHTVAALVECLPVLQAPQRLERGHRDQSHAAGCEHPRDFARRRRVVIDMLDDVGRQNEVEALVRKWKGAYVALLHRAQPLRNAIADRLVARIEAADRGKAETAQKPEIRPGARADVEHAIGWLDAALCEFCAEQPPAPHKPPVGRFNLGLHRIGGDIHSRAFSL